LVRNEPSVGPSLRKAEPRLPHARAHRAGLAVRGRRTTRFGLSSQFATPELANTLACIVPKSRTGTRARFDFHLRELGDLALEHLARRRPGQPRGTTALERVHFGAKPCRPRAQQRQLARESA
jgi:hypothetical protein